MRLRRAGVDDAQTIHDILAQVGGEGTLAPVEATLEDVRAFLVSEDAGAFIVADGQGDRGTAMFKSQGAVLWLFRIAVVATARGRGAGRALVNAVEAGARGAGAAGVFVQVEKHSEAQSFFTSLGYELDNEEPDVVAGRPLLMVDLVKLV